MNPVAGVRELPPVITIAIDALIGLNDTGQPFLSSRVRTSIFVKLIQIGESPCVIPRCGTAYEEWTVFWLVFSSLEVCWRDIVQCLV